MITQERSLFEKDIWIPKFKWQVVWWLSKRYPKDAKKFKRMKRDQLYGIYFSVRGICSGR